MSLPNYTQSLAGLDDQIYSSASSVTFKWTELSSLANYEVFVFGLDSDFSVTQAVTITGAGAAQNFTQQFAPNELAVNDAVGSSLQSLSDYAKQVQANAQGEITIDVNSVGSNFVSFAGLAIREVLAAQPITADLSVSTQGDEAGPVDAGPVDIVYTVTLSESNNTGAPITFDLNDLGTGSATSGLDYATIPPAAQINVASGSSAGTFAVTVLNDSFAEVNESVDVEISNPSDSSITLGVRTATASIRDDDPSTISVSVDSTVVGEDDAAVLTYTFTRDIASANASSLDVEFQLSGSATIGEDYTVSAASQVSFAVGASTATVMVDPTPDSLIEADETVTVTILDSEEYLLAESSSASASITNDDLGGESPQVAGIVYFNEDAEVEQSFSLDGTGQRSIIRKVQVTFSGPVAVPLGPVSDDSFVVESMSKRRQGTRVGLEVVSSDVVSGQQVVVLKFTGRELVENASLK